MTAPPLAEVALPLPLFRTFTYAVPEALRHALVPGSRVVVPLRGGTEIGIHLGPGDPATLVGRAGRVVTAKPIVDVPDAEPALTAELLALGRWIAEYYVVPIGIVLRSALPVALTGSAAPTPVVKTHRVAVLTRHVESLLHRERIFARAPQQRALYELLESLGGRAAVAHLLEQLRFSPSVLKGLVARGFAAVADETVARDPFAQRAGTPPPHTPTLAQQGVVDRMAAGRAGETFLLHGITGSGKTLVYIELLRRIVGERGRGAIVLVPEIALTPQTVDRFRGAFGDEIAVLHSALSDGERYDAWLALRRGEKRIAVGARSAVFAPVAELGAIIVDEEHEGSYKQGDAPRYHAREVAIVRARAAGAIAVLGSATPSLESWANAAAGKYTLLSLPARVGGGRLPGVSVVDLRQQPGMGGGARGGEERERERGRGPGDGGEGRWAASGGGPPRDQGTAARGSAPHPFDAPPIEAMHPGTPAPHAVASAHAGANAALRLVLSPPLEQALVAALARGDQAILLLNRRGYAAFVQCGACGDVGVCPNCSISLTYHRAPERLVCHYCLHQEPPRARCARCGGLTLRQRGMGTQQVERILSERFPAARIARMDVDTTGAKWAHAEILDRVGRGEVDVLLGTQMIAKGLDFPNVTLVGVIDADTGVNLPDFRASERCFQLLSQVAGRAGRGPKGGQVLIQTRMPEHHAVRCALTHEYERFVREEMDGRCTPPYPPMVRLANVIVSGTVEEETAALAGRATAWVRALLGRAGDAAGGVRVVGPAPCPVERVKQRWRWHFLLKAEQPGPLGRTLRHLAVRFEVPKRHGLRLAIDRDPVALL